MPSLWVEKYRPKTFEEMIDQDTPIALLSSFLRDGSMPHMIFRGPAGTGKTSAAHILVRTMFPPQLLNDRVLELNASEERGIRTVRGKIKRFVSSSVQQIPGVLPLSVVILDEADALTLDSQYALRRIMEDSSKTSRFILICNYINKIISPLLSRCTVINFNHLSRQSIDCIITRVCGEEKVSDVHKETVVRKNFQDARSAINYLQRLVTGALSKEDIEADWEEILSLKPAEILLRAENLLLDGNDIDSLLEHFVGWVMDKGGEAVSPFLTKTLYTCCNIANHGTPVIQLTNLLLTYASLYR